MLLASSRHRPEDLDCWSKQEMADRLNYRLRRVEEKAEKAMREIARFLRNGSCYLAVSWGKDSTVIAHLLWRLSQSDLYATLCPVYRVCMPGIETPGTDDVESAFLARWPLLRYRRVEVAHDPSWVRAEGKRERALCLGIEECARQAGSSRYINGLRAGESTVRRTQMRRGLTRARSCSPCGWWQTEDVFAYLAHHDLPVHPNYAMTLGGLFPRDRLRVCMLGNHKGRASGRLLWEKTYYGDTLDAMRGQHPNMVPEG